MDIRTMLRTALSDSLIKAGVSATTENIRLEHPAELKNGDYSSGVALQFAKQAGKNPRELAEQIVADLRSSTTLGPTSIQRIEVAGPGFVNFYLAPAALAESVEAARKDDKWGAVDLNKGKKIMVEYTDPNPFKEFHIGHLMSNAIGESVSRLLQFSGADVKRANYQGDVGPHVAKAIWGVRKLGGDAHDSAQLGKAYATGAQAYENDPAAKAEIDAINQKVYDKSDPDVNALYDAGREASLAHFEEIYKILGTKFDHYFFESETAPRGLKLVKEHSEVFTESDGAVVFEGSHTRVFVTSKGLPTYETKELGLAELKRETVDADMYLTITASEQDGFFKVVYEAIEKVLPELHGKLAHHSHGMMRFAEGKMSSRTGNVITGESLLNELIEAAKVRAAESRADDKEKLGEQIAVGAIKYQILRQASGKDIIFDRDRALSLEGDSGPYLQYAYARTNAILEKADSQGVSLGVQKGDSLRIPDNAESLARILHRFPEIVEYAAREREPHLLTNYLLELASAFNRWYAQVHILDGTPEAAHKVALVAAAERTLKNGLWILGIPAPEKM